MTIYTPEHKALNDKAGTVHRPQTKTNHRVRTQSVVMLVIGLFFTLFTYQYFHHGLWGKLNNYNKLPLIKMQGTTVQNNSLMLTLYRPNGPDTYGSFVEKVAIFIPSQKQAIETWSPTTLAQMDPTDIHNAFKFQHVHTGPWGLVVPLAAKATVNLPLTSTAAAAVTQAGTATVTVQDVSGVSWTYNATVK